MCITTSRQLNIRVSVQDRRAADRAAGHLATGVLVDGDVVLVPNPPASVLDPAADLEIVICPVDGDDHAPIDVIPIWKWSPFHHTANEHATAVIARLRHHSTYGAQISPVDSSQLAALTEELGGDLWGALIQSQAVREEIATVDAKQLTSVGAREREQREPRRSSHDFDSYDRMVGAFCIFFCFCNPHGPK
jgi:hypothetical protein